MQFLLRFHRFRRLLNSATAALSSRIDAHTLAGPLGRSACLLSPQDVVSQASKASPEMSNYPLYQSRRYTCQINTLRPSSHPGNQRPSICRIFALNLHSIDPAHAVYDAHLRRCTSHSMRQADPAKGSARKCDRSKVAGCLGCKLGLKELKPRQLHERLLRQSITGRCV